METEKVKRRKVLITAAFRSEMADEYALNDENGNPRYAVRLHANGGAFEADGTDLLYMKPRSLEFADQELFYVEATSTPNGRRRKAENAEGISLLYALVNTKA